MDKAGQLVYLPGDLAERLVQSVDDSQGDGLIDAEPLREIRELLTAERRVIKDDRPELVKRITNLANPSQAPGVREAMHGNKEIEKAFNEVEGNMIYLGIEDEIYAIAGEVLQLVEPSLPECTYHGCTETSTHVIAYLMGLAHRPSTWVAPYCEKHAMEIKAGQAGNPAGGPALSLAVESISGVR